MVLCVHLYTLCTLCGITVITIIQNTHVTDKNIFYKKFQKGHKQPESRLMTMCEVTDHLGGRNSFPAYEKAVLWPVQQQVVNYNPCMKPSEDTWGLRLIGCTFSEWSDSPCAMTPWGNSLGTFCSEPLWKQKPRWHDGRFWKAWLKARDSQLNCSPNYSGRRGKIS